MKSPFQFSAKTFAYFDGARAHATDRSWFEANQGLYMDGVEVPLTHLVNELRERLGPMLPGVAISARKISKPLLRKAKEGDGAVLRAKATAFFAETASSMFESNPGIYLSLGAAADDNVMGCGLYMPSGRQIRELRPRYSSDAVRLGEILGAPAIKAHWGGLSGDRYSRFPKGYDEHGPGAEYLWFKQFFLSKQVNRKDVVRAGFIGDAVEAFAAAVPFLDWTRKAVGVYKRPKDAGEREH